jgi:hypothetical protein
MSPVILSDLVTQLNSDNSQLTTDTAALVAAQAVVSSATSTVASDNVAIGNDKTAIGSAVATQGAFFVLNPDGTATAYEPDGAGGYTAKTLLPGNTTISPPTAAPVTGS